MVKCIPFLDFSGNFFLFRGNTIETRQYQNTSQENCIRGCIVVKIRVGSLDKVVNFVRVACADFVDALYAHNMMLPACVVFFAL